MNFKLVVAHYNESLEWLKIFPFNNMIVYTKGNKELESLYEVIKIPNVGREANTYLTYICENYSNLPDIVVFTQGSDDHLSASDIYKNLNIMNDNLNIMMSGHLYRQPSDTLFTSDNGRISEWGGKTLIPAESDFYTWFKKYIRNEIEESFYVYWNACFLVRRESILIRSLDFYKNLLKQTEIGESTEVAHFFERSWFYIFNN